MTAKVWRNSPELKEYKSHPLLMKAYIHALRFNQSYLHSSEQAPDGSGMRIEPFSNPRLLELFRYIVMYLQHHLEELKSFAEPVTPTALAFPSMLV